MAGKKNVFGSAAAKAKSVAPAHTAPKRNMVDRKLSSLEILDQDAGKTILNIDPAECEPWIGNHRHVERFNENRLSGLIDSMLELGEQHQPAIVMPLPKPRGKIKYAVVAGTRRHWAATWIKEHHRADFKLLAELRDLTPQQASLISGSENDDREGLSDYEKGAGFKSDLEEGYFSSQSELAKKRSMAESTVSKFIKMTELPIQVVNAYADWADLKVSHTPKLLELLKKPTTAKALMKKATELQLQHEENERKGAKPMTGQSVLTALLSVGKKPSKRGGPVREYGDGDTVHLKLESVNRHGLKLFVPSDGSASDAQLVKAFKECLREYRKR